jgi:hypothetical protein
MNEKIDVAVSFSENSPVFAPLCVFTCGMGLYAYMRRLPFTPSQPLQKNEAVVMEIIDLESHSLGKGLSDYCLIASSDMLAQMKAQKCMSEGAGNENCLASIKLSEARTLNDMESALGCRILAHPQALASLYYHDRLPQ